MLVFVVCKFDLESRVAKLLGHNTAHYSFVLVNLSNKTVFISALEDIFKLMILCVCPVIIRKIKQLL